MTGLAIADGDIESVDYLKAEVAGQKGVAGNGKRRAASDLTEAQCTLIDNLINAIYELRQQGKKLTTPDDVLAEMLRQKSFFTSARLTFTELIVLAARKGFIQYVKNNNGLYICKFKYEAADFEGIS
ncbi:hypothetical protein QFC24_000043 [Naganishia onofrii]|uniref:Uncharacterized protein n=1 Tax=Naganishia onofrii TaxID=1851511 RepID=A0ACC2XVV9_9TREE|nr:hypothetical protein QFC24_000043 [Naganishia onofrii]